MWRQCWGAEVSGDRQQQREEAPKQTAMQPTPLPGRVQTGVEPNFGLTSHTHPSEGETRECFKRLSKERLSRGKMGGGGFCNKAEQTIRH